MAKKLALIHTASSLVAVFAQICKETIPDVEVYNVVDESLINNTIVAGALVPATARRVAAYIELAEEAGADMVLVTCSSIGPAVDAARPFVSIPVLRVDQPMADRAVSLGKRIGVIATLSTTLEPTSDLLKGRAAAQGRPVEIISHLCAGAFQLLVHDANREAHDQIVVDGLKELMAQKVDVIVLAQASMARAVKRLSRDELTVPILSSPQLGIDAAKKVLARLNSHH